jgi:hypothetical protein
MAVQGSDDVPDDANHRPETLLGADRRINDHQYRVLARHKRSIVEPLAVPFEHCSYSNTSREVFLGPANVEE